MRVYPSKSVQKHPHWEKRDYFAYLILIENSTGVGVMMAQRLRAVVAFAENPALVPESHMAAHNNSSSRGSNAVSGSMGTRYTHGALTDMQAKHL